ncbi:uncharacterized protein LOC131666994 [Phymastichus coffea]|uniref:uncharacterized protein LOC131666994 n=1 Tax=Phymastichus coffea TaxID=108790 RepID=UPI00273BBA0B|nr:uncharacterized protein LOC131666994 [Phymastichus coffea]
MLIISNLIHFTLNSFNLIFLLSKVLSQLLNVFSICQIVTLKFSPSRQRRTAQPNPKPYGFCCLPNDESLPRHGLDTSLSSLKSLHECPALKIREQEIVKRPSVSRSKDGIKGSRRSLALNLSHHSSGGPGGMKLTDLTESMIEMMIDIERAQRQAEYEQRIDRWAAIGERKTKEIKLRKLKCGPPCWYTDYSPSQLQHLKDLEDAMFKDKKENTINRTAYCLASIGMTTDFVTVDSQILRKLVKEHNADIKTFICELYKAIRGNYFEKEGKRLDYTTHERIMISGVVFLELPQVILELHRRLPAIIKFKFPSKPKSPKLMIAKKMISPLLEKLYPSVNWKLYATQMLKWRRKCLATPRPVAILPKETKELAVESTDNADQQKVISEKNNQLADDNEANVKVAAELDTEVKNSTSDVYDQDKHAKKNSRQVSVIEKDYQRDTPLFTIENPWTEPPTPCPMKYIKLLREAGPLKTDAEFFSQLNRPACKRQVTPSFRLQSVLLDAEADLYGLMHEANQLTGEVTRIAKEILEPDTGCDACCSCRETRRAHLMWHATKAPHAVVDGIVTDNDDKAQVIGAMAMYSPAESISSTSQPPCVPSSDKLVKNKIITGTITMVDSEPVNQIAGFTKTVEHVPREFLRPDVNIVEVKNVPPCGCQDRKRNEELEQQVLSAKNDESLCYGKKFRPEQGPTYTCSEFQKKDEQENCGCRKDIEECVDEDEYFFENMEGSCDEDDCGYEDDAYKCSSKNVIVKSSKKQRLICERCGRELRRNCIDINAKKHRQSSSGTKVIKKCSCDSLSEFLQMDIGKAKCIMPKRDYYTKEKASKKSKKTGKNRKNDEKVPKEKIPRMKVERPSRVKRVSQLVPKQDIEEDDAKENSEHESVEGGPYGYRTKSEEALPIERTLAYLVDPHPPIRPAERIPVREGGRPCCCRENRNKRKTLMYGIGAVVDENEANGTRVIDGLTWVTPEPSIRGSDEYIPEYELADSPYEKQICGRNNQTAKRGYQKADGKAEGNDTEKNRVDRTEDWENAFKDEYLTEFFTKKRDCIPCWTKCSKFKKTDTARRKLKVMKPVCECKYERRIVKRNEERKKWRDRQERLKSLDKEAFLLIDDIAKPDFSDSGENCNVTVISAVTMQTPCVTPDDGPSRSHLPYPIQKIEIVKKNDELKDVVDTQQLEKPEDLKIENEGTPIKSPQADTIKESIKEMDDKQAKELVQEDEIKEIEFTEKMSRCKSFFDQAEQELTDIMETELKKMSAECDFISLKLPNYHKLAQLSYWISYRVRGMCFTEKIKKDLMLETTKIWNSKRLTNKMSIESLKISKVDRCKLNFDHAKYWKRKVMEMHRKFYAKTRQETIEIGREMWPTMEYGKFPHMLFKQAYFTYLPSREVDIYAFRTYSMN